jgi:uncharacterized protein
VQLLDDQLILSASDLNNYVACPHLTTLDLTRARGELDVEPERGDNAELLARKGDEHELRYLQSLKEAEDVYEISQDDRSHEALLAAVAETEEAMRAGAGVDLSGDLPPRRPARACRLPLPRRSSVRLGDYSYEVADTKLAPRRQALLPLANSCEPHSGHAAEAPPSGLS